MKTIWKFELNPSRRSAVSMPKGAQVLDVHEQDGGVFIWAVVDPNAPVEKRWFEIYGTGHDLPNEVGSYVGTAHLPGIGLVMHVFEG